MRRTAACERHEPGTIRARGTPSTRALRVFYVLQAAWPNSNLGTADMYRNDHDVHWRTSSAEMRWLRHDLRTHHRRVSFAFFHFPLYADSATEGSDPWLQGPRRLEGVLGKHGVDIVSTATPHLRAQRAIITGMPISYVTGGGGGKLQPVSRCGPHDRYAIGWAYSAHTHGSACGSAAAPSSIDHVLPFPAGARPRTVCEGRADRRSRSSVRRHALSVLTRSDVGCG
jgi:hypothetical protein